MKAFEQYFHGVLFITLYNVVLTFKSVDETLVFDHSNKSYWAVVSCGLFCCTRWFQLLSLWNSHLQRAHSFLSAPRTATFRKVQHRKSAIHGLPVILRKSDNLIGWQYETITLRTFGKFLVLTNKRANSGDKNEFVNETLVCDHSNESYWAVLS